MHQLGFIHQFLLHISWTPSFCWIELLFILTAGSTPTLLSQLPKDRQELGEEISSLIISFNNVSYFSLFCCPVPLALVVFLVPDYFPWTSDYHCACLPFDLVSSASLTAWCLFVSFADSWPRLLISLSSCPFIYFFTSPWHILQSPYPGHLPRPVDPSAIHISYTPD